MGRSKAKPRRRASAFTFFYLLAVALTAAIFLLLWRQAGLTPAAAYVVAINTVTLLLYAYDKGAARRGRLMRVPEQVLHVLALAGGSPAALLGRGLFRHKTLHRQFGLILWLIVALHAALAAAWFTFVLR